MIIPTKITPIYKSYIYKSMILLRRKNTMYEMNQDIFTSIVDYIDTMTVLFLLGYVDEKGNIINDI